MTKLKSVGIIGTGSALPERIMTNYDLEKIVETSHEWIVTRTGIEERRIADEKTTTSDLAYEAALKALEMAKTSPEELDLIIVATITPDMMFPATACILQDRLKATKAAAFDLEAACSGFLYGVTTAQQFIATGYYKKVLVIGGEVMSKIVDFTDRGTCVLFGDGAGAVVMGEVEEGFGLLSTELGSKGEGGKFLYQPAGGSLEPASAESVANRRHFVKMGGPEVFKFAVRIMGESSVRVIEKAGLNLEDVDYLVPHQANTRIIEAAAKRIKLPMNRVKVNLNRYGNMSAASIPVALDEAVRGGEIKKGDHVVLVGFGGGLTWGAALIRW